MESIDLSIIIVSWNAKDYLVKCLDSIINQKTKYRHEIVVVDNASIDGSLEVLRFKYPGVKVIQNSDNLGFAKANNIGIAKSSGKYVCFINSDVEVLENCIENMYIFMEENKDVGISGPKILGKDRIVQRSCMGFPTLWNLFSRSMALDLIFPKTRLFGSHMMTYWTHDSIREVDVINGCFWMVRREAIIQIGPLDETFFIYGEDIDWCRRFHESGWRVIFYPLAEAIHYGGGSSKNAPLRFYIEMQKANFLYWKKYHNRISQKSYLILRIFHESIRAIGHAASVITRSNERSISVHKVKRSLLSISWAARSMF